MTRLRYSLWLSLFFFINEVQAQTPLSFDKISMEDGFSSGKANTIIQDRKGYIWIGTWNGLNRYDGYECKVYTPILRDSSSLSNREIVSLLEDNNGKIWIGTTSGLNCLDPSTEKIKSYPFQERIIALHQDEYSRIWIGTWGGGLYILDPSTGKREHYFENSIISDICYVSKDNYWLASYNGLIEFNPIASSHKVYLPNSSKNSISNSTITQVKKSKDSTLWIGTWGGGLNKLVIAPNSSERIFTHYKINPKNKNSIVSNVIYRIHIDKFDNIWCGTWDKGLILLTPSEQNKSPKAAKFQNYQTDFLNPKSISGNNISSLFVDRSGVLWIGALHVNYCSVLKSNIEFYQTQKFENGELSNSNVRSILSEKEHLWVGTSQEINLYKFENGFYKLKKKIPAPTYQYNGIQYQSSSILTMTKNKYGLWIGTDDAGIMLYPNDFAKKENSEPIAFFNNSTPNCYLPGNKINNIVTSQKDSNVLWVTSTQHGVARLAYNGGEATSHIITQGNDDFHLSDNNIRALAEDRDGIIWIGTQNGLNAYNPITNKIKRFYYSLEDTSSINNNVINCIFEDSSGELWIGTNSGLNKKITQTTANGEESVCFKSYQSLKRIGNDIICSIIEDDSNHLWIKPYRGLILFDPYNERPIRDFLTREYLDLNLENNAVCKTPTGTLCFGGIKGFITLHPDSISVKTIPPIVSITDIKILNESLNKLNHTDGVTAPFIKKLNLTHKDKVITIVFSAMDFKNPSRNKYAYFLEGRDKSWHEIGYRNFITFNNLSPGNYTFLVKASNSDGNWGENSASLKLHISPPWNRTIVAFIIYILLIIAILYFFNKYSVIRIKEKSRLMLEVIKGEKENKLNDHKTLFFTDITHEFRTPLTLIQGPAEEIFNQSDISPYIKKQAHLILRNTNRLLRLVNQLMDFRKVDRGKMDIVYQKCNISNIIKEVYDSYKGVAKSRSIDFSLNLPKNNIETYLDRDKIEKTLYNLTSNAFKFSDDGGKISLSIQTRELDNGDEALIIEIEDEGIGIAEEDQERVFERFTQTHQKSTHSTGGIGLYLSKTFVEQHDGWIELESELGQGSCFRIILPIKSIDLLKNGEIITKEKEVSLKDNNEISKSIINEKKVILKEKENRTKKTNENTKLSTKPTNDYTILVVDDDFDLNSFIVSSLSQEFNVISAINGYNGLEMARKHSPDIIITDVMMPEMDGFELCQQLREDIMTSHIPVIFLTAKTLQEDQLEGLQLGAVDYIYKPFNIKALKHKIHNVLATNDKSVEYFKKNQLMKPKVEQLSSLDDKLLKKAVEAVEKNLDDPTFDVDKFSIEIGLSSNQAYRKIKALTGQTAKEFIRNQRLKTAASLFLQKKRSISEVIYMVGFSSPSYFTRCFKEYFNCTPKEYIANNEENDLQEEEED